MHTCPILGCNMVFYSRYGLANHLRRTREAKHVQYANTILKKKICTVCGRAIDKRSLNQNICFICRSSNNKKIPKQMVLIKCYSCGEPDTIWASPKTTRALCNKCKKVSLEKKRSSI